MASDVWKNRPRFQFNVIPPFNDLEGMAAFLEANPGWSPTLDDNGVPNGIITPSQHYFTPLPPEDCA